MNSTSGQNQQPNPKIQSFLESLRQRSATRGPKPEGGPTSGFSFEAYQEKKRLEKQRRQEFFRSRQKEFNEVYNLKQKKQEKRVEELRNSLKQLAASQRKLQKEIQVAVETPIAEVGQYHESVLDHLRQMIDILNRQVNSSATWLHLFNQRSKKKGHYWGQVKNAGTKYMLSEERGLATSIG